MTCQFEFLNLNWIVNWSCEITTSTGNRIRYLFRGAAERDIQMANDGVKYVDVCTKAAIELNIRAYIGYSSTKLLQSVRYSKIPLNSLDSDCQFQSHSVSQLLLLLLYHTNYTRLWPDKCTRLPIRHGQYGVRYGPELVTLMIQSSNFVVTLLRRAREIKRYLFI